MFKKSKRKLEMFILLIIILFIFAMFILKNIYSQKNNLNSGSSIEQKNNLNSSSSIEQTNIIIPPAFLVNKENEEEIIEKNYKNYDWRIVIPKIKIDAPILEDTTLEVLRKGVGHFTSTEKKSGNICLAAHNRGYKYNYFQEIKKLQVGDSILYIVDGSEKNFEVIDNKIIEETDLSVLENTQDTQLTLITCEENQREFRRCIIAKEIP